MKPVHVHLSLAPPGIGFLRGAQWALLLFMLASLISMGWLWQDSQVMREQAEQYERATERVQETNRQFAADTQRIGIVLSQGRVQAMAREVTFANRLLETRAFSWTKFLNDLEQAVPEHISIKSVQLNFKDSAITLNGNALTLKDVTVLLDELEKHPAFFNVTLAQHKLQDNSHDLSDTSIQPIDFGLTVGYRPAH